MDFSILHRYDWNMFIWRVLIYAQDDIPSNPSRKYKMPIDIEGYINEPGSDNLEPRVSFQEYRFAV